MLYSERLLELTVESLISYELAEPFVWWVFNADDDVLLIFVVRGAVRVDDMIPINE